MPLLNQPCQYTVTDSVSVVSQSEELIDWDQVEWEQLLEEWSAELEGDRWITLAEAEVETGMSRSALRSWYRSGQIRSRMVEGPNGPQRLVPRDAVRLRAALATKRQPTVKLNDEVARLREQVTELSERLAALEGERAALAEKP